MKALPILLLVILWQAPLPAAEPIEPAKPGELIKYLPPKPEDMKVLQSFAKNDLRDWMVTVAGRDFERPAPTAEPGTPPLPPAILRVRITDTGYWPASLTKFQNFQPGKSESEELLLWEGLPMIRQRGDDKTKQRALICVANRYLILVDASDCKDKEMDGFLKTLPLDELTRFSPAGGRTLPQPAVITEIDEINPAKNRTYRVFKTDAPE